MDAFYLNQDHPTKTEFVLTTWNMLRERNMFFDCSRVSQCLENVYRILASAYNVTCNHD